ncbi:hypothetical protein ABZ682_22870 [Streptomyces griseoviridis]|uniref:hypothetical protein n=1 Tax=Streptomyces griseoviridis TaxID=45398 RepID=UPI0033FA02C2
MNDFTAAARRLRLAADVVDRHARHRTRSMIDVVTEGLRSAAGAFEDTAPCPPGELPEELCDAMAALGLVLVAQNFELSGALVAYAIMPVTGEAPPMKDLAAVSETLAWRDFELRTRRRTLLCGGPLDSVDDETVSWALRCLAQVHYRHERLAVEVQADNAAPGNRSRRPVQLLPAARTAPDHRDA